jgi:hypothetical protein
MFSSPPRGSWIPPPHNGNTREQSSLAESAMASLFGISSPLTSRDQILKSENPHTPPDCSDDKEIILTIVLNVPHHCPCGKANSELERERERED